MKTTVRRPFLKALALILLAVAALLAATALWVHSVAAERRQGIERLVRELQAEALARDGARPILYGEALPGNAWPDYLAALEDVKPLQRKESETLFEYWSKHSDAGEALVRALIRDHAVAFDRLRQGAHRTVGNYPFNWENGLRCRPLQFDEVAALGRLATCRARFLAAEGKVSEPLEAILDVFQLARDLGSNSISAGRRASTSLWWIALVDLKDIVFSEEFPRRDLSRLEGALEQLDRTFPLQAPILLNDTLCVGYELLKPMESNRYTLELGRLQCWRYAFSRQIGEADAYDRIVAAVRKVAPVQDGTARELQASRYTVCFEQGRPDNPLLWHTWQQNLQVSDTGTRHEHAALRLLRIAAHYRSTGEVLELDDPLGDRLHHSIRGSDLRVWSVGENGDDDDGHDDGVDWLRRRPAPVPGQRARYARDLVLQIER